MRKRTFTAISAIAASCVLLAACATGVIPQPIHVAPETSREIRNLEIELVWSEAAPDFTGYARTRGEAAREGALAPGVNMMSSCYGEDCLAALILAPILAPFSAAANAAMSDGAEDVAAYETTIREALTGRAFASGIETALETAIRSRTPYEISAAGRGDARLRVIVRPLQISGEREYRQNVRVLLSMQAQLIRLAPGGGEITLFDRSYALAYLGQDTMQLSDVAAQIDQIADWIPEGGSVMAGQIAEDAYSGFAARIPDFQIDQPRTALACVFSECRPAEIDSLQPELSWTPIAEADPRLTSTGPPIRYEIKIVRAEPPISGLSFDNLGAIAAAETRLDGPAIYQAGELSGSRHVVARPLQPCTAYFWRVRASRGAGETGEISDWRDYHIARGENFPMRLPWFATPCASQSLEE